MLSKVKRAIAMILVLGVVLSLAGCKKEEEVDPNADPLTLLEQPELIQMINDLNSDLEKQIAHSQELQEALDARGDKKLGSSITETSDSSKRITLTTVDSMISMPTPWAYPDSSLAPNTSSINISDTVKVETDQTWLLYLDGSSLILNHVDGISGNITVGTLGQDGQNFKVAEIQTYIQDTLFKDFPIENPVYKPLYVADKQRGVDVIGTTRIDDEAAMIRCGVIGYNTLSVQYFFVYQGEQRLTYDEAIRRLLATMTIRNNQLAI